MTTKEPSKPIEAVVYAYKRTPTNGKLTPVRIADCEEIGPRQFRDLAYLRECLEIVNKLGDDTLYLFDFSGQDLRGVDLANIDLKGCRFRDCNLEGAEFGGAELAGADFTGANLRNARLRNIYAPNRENSLRNKFLANSQMMLPFDRYDFGPVIFDKADLTGADLTIAQLSGVSINGANLSRTRLDMADFSKARFHDTRFDGAMMHKTDIDEATFTNSPLSSAQINHAFGKAISHSRNEARRLRRVNRPSP